MLKPILALSKIDDLKAFRLLNTTSVDVAKHDELKEIAESGLSPGDLAKIALANRFIKLFQNAILLHVN